MGTRRRPSCQLDITTNKHFTERDHPWIWDGIGTWVGEGCGEWQGWIQVRHTDVVRQEVGGEAFGAVAQRRVVVGVPAKDEERSAQKHGGVQVAGIWTLLQDCPGMRRKTMINKQTQTKTSSEDNHFYSAAACCIWKAEKRQFGLRMELRIMSLLKKSAFISVSIS